MTDGDRTGAGTGADGMPVAGTGTTGPRGPRRARVRPWRVYLGLALVDAVILGGLLYVALTSPAPPTLAELGPVATSLTALVALNVGVVTVAQKRVADARAAWWSRAQWALERSMEESVRSRVIGQLTLAHLVHSDLVTADDLALIEAIPDAVVAGVEVVDPEQGAGSGAAPPDTLEVDVIDVDPEEVGES